MRAASGLIVARTGLYLPLEKKNVVFWQFGFGEELAIGLWGATQTCAGRAEKGPRRTAIDLEEWNLERGLVLHCL